MLHCNLERIFHFCPFLIRLNRKAVCSIHFNGRVRGKLTDVCNDASGIRNERPKFLAMKNLEVVFTSRAFVSLMTDRQDHLKKAKLKM